MAQKTTDAVIVKFLRERLREYVGQLVARRYPA